MKFSKTEASWVDIGVLKQLYKAWLSVSQSLSWNKFTGIEHEQRAWEETSRVLLNNFVVVHACKNSQLVVESLHSKEQKQQYDISDVISWFWFWFWCKKTNSKKWYYRHRIVKPMFLFSFLPHPLQRVKEPCDEQTDIINKGGTVAQLLALLPRSKNNQRLNLTRPTGAFLWWVSTLSVSAPVSTHSPETRRLLDLTINLKMSIHQLFDGLIHPNCANILVRFLMVSRGLLKASLPLCWLLLHLINQQQNNWPNLTSWQYQDALCGMDQTAVSWNNNHIEWRSQQIQCQQIHSW